MIKIMNYNGEYPNILHFQGKSKNHFKSVWSNILKNTLLEPIDNLTIITCYTDRNESCLAECLERNHIPYVNAFTGNPEDKWEMPNKLFYYNEALKNVTTDYVLLLDGNDVVIQDLNILDKFKKTGLDILFNATKNNWPKVLIDKIHDRDWRGEFRYLNAGCVIGKTKVIKDFYKEAERRIFMYDNPYKSEQLIIRHVFEDSDKSKVDYDWKCNIFQSCSESIIQFINTEEINNLVIDNYQIL